MIPEVLFYLHIDWKKRPTTLAVVGEGALTAGMIATKAYGTKTTLVFNIDDV